MHPENTQSAVLDLASMGFSRIHINRRAMVIDDAARATASRNNADLWLPAQSDESDDLFCAESCCDTERIVRMFGVIEQ